MGDTYWNNNTGGNTVDGFNVTIENSGVHESDPNAFFFNIDGHDIDANENYFATWVFTADNLDLSTFSLDSMDIKNWGSTFYLDFTASNGASYRYSSLRKEITTVNIDETLFKDISWFKVKVTVDTNELNNMDLKAFTLADLKAPVSNTPPTLSGTFTTAGTVNDNATMNPFSSVTVADTESNPVSIAITYTGANGTLTGTGISGSAGNYTLASAPLATVQANLRALVFHPTANQVAPASTVVTTFTLTPNDGTVNGTANATTKVTATSINDAPTNITLSNTSVNQSGGTNATVGTLGVIDADTGDGATYTLVSGTGDSDNSSFNINGTTLRANDTSTLGAGGYAIRVNVSDGDANFAKLFNITVVDDIIPTITNVFVPAGTYKAGDNLDFRVYISENVFVVTTGGTPSLSITVGATTRQATYVSGAGSSGLLFRYTVQNNESDSDGIVVGTLATNGGTIKDTATGNNLTLTLSGVGSTLNVKVDSVVPTLSNTTYENVGKTTVDIKGTSNEVGTLYYVIATSSSSPTFDQVVTNTVTGSVKNGSSAVTANTVKTFNVTGLNGGTTYYYYVVAQDTVGNKSSVTSGSFTSNSLFDTDTTLTPSATLTEPINLPTTANTEAEAVSLFDFTLTDGGTSDGLATTVSQIILHTSGTADFSKVAWLLNGASVSNVVGTYNSTNNTLTFTGLNLGVADGASATYTVLGYYTITSGLINHQTYILSLNGDSDLTVNTSGSQMSGSNSAVSNGSGSEVDVTATKLIFITEPSN